MVHAVIYVMRGWIAFVAFIDFSTSIRCFIDETEFLRGNVFIVQEGDEAENVTSTLARLMGRYCLLNGVIMVHCAVCIHHLPVIVLSICTLTLTILFYGSEAFYYYTAAVNFYVLFPISISFFTIICLIIAPYYIEEEPKRKKIVSYDDEDEEEDYETILIKKKSQIHPELAHRMKKTQ